MVDLRIAAATIAGLASLAVTPLALAGSSTPEAADCPARSTSEVLTAEAVDGEDALECHLVGQFVAAPEEGLTVEIPKPGTIVVMENYAETEGASAALSVAVSESGEVDARVESEQSPEVMDSTAGSASAPVGNPCEQDDYTSNNRKWYAVSDWNINLDSINEDDLDPTNTVASLREAIQNIANSDNSCGLSDLVSATGDYRGDTSAFAPIWIGANGASGCTSENYDNINVVAFGPRPPGVLATTCSRAYTGDVVTPYHMIEVDMEIDRDDRNWTTLGGAANCQGAWDLESTATHEFGHWFGLGHTSQQALTMYTYAFGTCDIAARTLGRGDVLGLRNLY